MERGYKQPESIQYSQNEEPIVLSKHLLDTLLKEENPTDLISLYCFYYYTAKWQQTNRPKATDQYCMNGLKIGWDRFSRAKKQLIQLKLIEIIKIQNNKNQVSGWFIQVNFIWKKETINQNPENQVLVKVNKSNNSNNFPELGNPSINALSSNIYSLTSFSNKKSTTSERNKKYFPLANKLSSIIRTKKNIKHSKNQIMTWTNSIRQMEESQEISYDRIYKALKWYRLHINEQYVPVIESGKSLQEKFMKLENAMAKDGYKPTPQFYPGQKRADGAQWKKCPDDKFHWVKFDDNGARYIEDSEGVFRRAGGTPWID